MRNLKVEELSKEDASEIEALFKRVWTIAFEYPEKWREKRILTCQNIKKEMENGYHYFGIRMNGKFVGVYKAKVTEHGLFGEHQSVDPDYQGLGLAKAMYQHFIKYAKDHGSPRVYVNILANQGASKRIMENFGFHKKGREYEQTKGMLVQMYEKEV